MNRLEDIKAVVDFHHLLGKSDALWLIQELEATWGALAKIGNIAGGPTMSYSPEIERNELLSRIQKINEIVVLRLKK
jgi:hypothetical protein